ncbi:MAG: CoA activase [Firmicutes bacterium HGW-Firmicutes-16]|nr:MAG: CoA activase [Firmicutes bacterium HGW-Firmicutes-16]
MYYIGIDVGSACSKYAVIDEQNEVLYRNVIPTGWSSSSAAEAVRQDLLLRGYNPEHNPCVATGYGRNSVEFADKAVTEITCHCLGASHLFGDGASTVIDIGGQDTKIINISGGIVQDFLMNDKCSAGTGRFVEIMAKILELDPMSLCALAESGTEVTISSMCTVFAESEVIGLIGRGVKKADIAFGIVDSVASKVASQCGRIKRSTRYYLTGGLCECRYLMKVLGDKLGVCIVSNPEGRYAGALGAALSAKKLEKGGRTDG